MKDTTPEIKCPECGLVVKLTTQALEKCPVCGAKLPSVPGLKKQGTVIQSTSISLEDALFKSPRSKESWAPREFLNIAVLTFFVTTMVRYVVLIGWVGDSGTITFDPALAIATYLIGLLTGIIPIIYTWRGKMPLAKLGLKKLTARQWLDTLFLGVICGFGLFFFDAVSTLVNRAIFEATGWEMFNINEDFLAFFTANMWNRVSIIVPYGAAQILAEFFYRGTIASGFVQRYQKKKELASNVVVKAKAWVVSVMLCTLFEFAMSFDLSAILLAFMVHAALGIIFIITGNLESCLIAQATYILIMLLL